jgi:RNA polymerase sigma factor (sigma-70 family)
MVSLRAIIEDCKKGKYSAQSTLYTKFSSKMLGVCLRYCRNREEAEDIFQDGFIKVFLNIRNFTYNDENDIEKWMRRIMVNTAINHRRDNMKYYKQANIDEIDETDIIDDHEIEEENKIQVSHEKVLEIIQLLPEGYRMVFNLYVFEKFSHCEIAAALNITESTSKSQLFKARRFIRCKLTTSKIFTQ